MVFPDWFNPASNAFWSKEFEIFFSPNDGLDIDGVWIDMNEPASFCYYPCSAVIDKVNVTEVMLTLGDVPPLEPALEAPGQTTESEEVNLQRPPYAIKNDLPRLSDRTAPVDAVHSNGLLEYDTRAFESFISVMHDSQK